MDPSITTSKSTPNFTELLCDCFGYFRHQKNVSLDSSKQLVKKLRLQEDNGDLLNLDESNMHENFRRIMSSFQKHYLIRIGFVEGAHRDFAIFKTCFNIKFLGERTLSMHSTYDTPFQFTGSQLDGVAQFDILSCVKSDYVWKTTTAVLREISSFYCRQ